jgi:hypothetical protein
MGIIRIQNNFNTLSFIQGDGGADDMHRQEDLQTTNNDEQQITTLLLIHIRCFSNNKKSINPILPGFLVVHLTTVSTAGVISNLTFGKYEAFVACSIRRQHETATVYWYTATSSGLCSFTRHDEVRLLTCDFVSRHEEERHISHKLGY